MKLAHLILAYNQPQQLKRLITRLYHKDADFFIHIDAKSDLRSFSCVQQLPNVFFIQQRVTIKWGSYSIVQATLNGFEEIIAFRKNYTYVNLLSGHDYPLQSAEEIHAFLADNTGKLFMEFYDVKTVWKEALPRITKYHFTKYNFPAKHKLAAIVSVIFPKRKMPLHMQAVGRSQWFTITLEAVKYICAQMKQRPSIARFFKLTWAPDEMIFQTILYNSRFRENMVNDNLRYIDWSAGKASPKTITIKDIDALKTCEKLFARKFNSDDDETVLAAIDNFLQPHFTQAR